MTIENDVRIKIGVQGYAVVRWYDDGGNNAPEPFLYLYTEEPGEEAEPVMVFSINDDYPLFLRAVERAHSALLGGL